MSWAKFDDQYPDHPKIVEVGPLGMALHIAATCYCARYLTDGFVPSAMISRLISFDGIQVISNGVSNAVTNNQVTNELVRVGLFEVVEGGYRVHDYLEYNPPAEQIKAERLENARRQQEWRKKHRDEKGKFDSNVVTNTVTNTSYNTAPYPYPLINNNRENPENPPPVETISILSERTREFLKIAKVPFTNIDQSKDFDELVSNLGWEKFVKIATWASQKPNVNTMSKLLSSIRTAGASWTDEIAQPAQPSGYKKKPTKAEQLAAASEEVWGDK